LNWRLAYEVTGIDIQSFQAEFQTANRVVSGYFETGGKTLNFFDAFLLRRFSRTIIYDFDDAIMYSDKDPDRRCSRRKYARPFERTVRLSDMVIAGNSYLAEHAKEYNCNVAIIPTGLDTSLYQWPQERENDGKIRLVWIGSGSTLKYLAEIRPVLEEIGRRFENVLLRIICDEFFDLENMEVEKRTWSLKTQVGDLAGGDIGLAPLCNNRFTQGKCGFKILQYAACGLPVIASSTGMHSEFLREGLGGFVVNDISGWIDSIRQLVENPELRKSMGAGNLSFVRDFDFQVLGTKLAQLIKETAK